MDKFEKILDIIDHQEKYTDDEVREILRDEECRKLYQTMQEVDSALLKQSLEDSDEKAWEGEDEKSSQGLNVDEAWAKFSEEHHVEENAEVIPMNSHADEHRPFSWRKIAASIVGFVLAFRCFKEEEIYKTTPTFGVVINGFVLVSYVALYILGVL